MVRQIFLAPLLVAATLATCSLAASAELLKPDAKAAADLAAREAAVPENAMKQAYFGETHIHTAFSLDAYIGGARLTPFDAYRFARGEDVSLNNKIHNIIKPLDFAAVTDHAEFIGEMYSTQVKSAPGHYQESLDKLRGLTDVNEQREWFVTYVMENNRSANPQHPPFYAGPETTQSAWKEFIIKAADQFYQPGIFTTLIGYEWTAAPKAANMHRNVIFRDNTVPDAPYSALESADEEKLWAWMGEQEAKGVTLLAIPHNSNGSKGMMFEPVDNSGNAIDATYAATRAKREPLIEMMQVKGNSEVVSSLWPADEFADFENSPSLATYSERTFQKENFVRWAVTKGLVYQTSLGVNPYKLGFVGGTDNHNGTPADVVESNYSGSHGSADRSIKERREGEIDGWLKAAESNPGAVTGVWAAKNTRGAIYDAMAARETFTTSGTRIKPRFFAGPALGVPKDPVTLVKDGYAGGVPMGSTLTKLSGPPSFTVHAMKDPDGANLDRIQIIKGWVDAAGEPQERIVDVTWSGGRQPDAKGRLPAVGNTVDVKTATFTNGIGAAELIGHWTDDKFDAKQPALYYVRVMEIPTPRWTTYDAVKNGMPLLDSVPAIVQERAWTSPIWYTP